MSMSSRNAVSVTERERRLAARTEQWLVGKVEDYLDKQRYLRIEQERIPIVDAVAKLCAAGFPIIV